MWHNKRGTAAEGTPRPPNRDLQAAGRLLPVPAAHSAGLLNIARGTCCEARACSRVVPRHEARLTAGRWETEGEREGGREKEDDVSDFFSKHS
jgi:hypothetical protein